MKGAFPKKVAADVIDALVASDSLSACKIISEKLIVRATWRNKPASSHKREEIVVTFGEPNYREREFIRICKLAKEPFPIKKIQYRAYPKKARV